MVSTARTSKARLVLGALEPMQEMYAQFGAWQAKFEKNLVDMGGKLGQGRLVTTQPAADGPFVEVKELVGGYMAP